MKRNNFRKKTATLTILAGLTLVVCQAWAAVPISVPEGLALDANGNLYVANLGSGGTGQVLLYSPTYVQKKAITAGVVNPTGVALDSHGNLYVSNLGNFTVTKYNSAGTLQPNATITSGLRSPEGIAVDGLDDVWVNNANTYISRYSIYGTSLGTTTPGVNVNAMALQGALFVMGSDTFWNETPAGEVLALGGATIGTSFPSHDDVQAVAFDSNGNYWVAQATGEVDIVNPSTSVASSVFFVSYPPAGIAVDSRRGHVFISSIKLNRIDVYTTAGTFITSIQ